MLAFPEPIKKGSGLFCKGTPKLCAYELSTRLFKTQSDAFWSVTGTFHVGGSTSPPNLHSPVLVTLHPIQLILVNPYIDGIGTGRDLL